MSNSFLLSVEDLLDELHLQAWLVSPDLRLRLLRYVARHGSEVRSVEDWKHRLAAILCHDAEEQQAFYSLFDAFWQRLLDRKPLETTPVEQPAPSPTTDTTTPPPPSPTPAQRRSSTAQPVARATQGRSGPIRVELSFPDHPARFWNTAALDRALPPLLEKEWIPVPEWDVPATIRATIRAGGRPTFRQRRRKRSPQYLLLIDQRSARDHQAGLFAELGLELRRRDLSVEWYFYDRQPHRCWRDRRDPAAHEPIERLMTEYPGAKLLLVGEADGLLALPELWPSNLVLDLLDAFPKMALLSTKSTAQWGRAELTLCQLFPVAPASAAGLASLISQWQATEVFTPYYWQQEAPEPSVPSVEFLTPEELDKVIENLKYYLGRAGFPWLCAAAVYPEVYYELTALLNDESIAPDPRLTEWDQNRVWLTALQRLSRLPWLRKGEIPLEARTRLRQALSQTQAWDVRRQLLEVLKMEANRPPDGTYAAADRDYTEAWLSHENDMMQATDPSQRDQLQQEFQQHIGHISLSEIEDAVGRDYFRALLTPTESEAPPPDTTLDILWVDDEPHRTRGLRERMQELFHARIHEATTTRLALDLLSRETIELVISDFGRPDETDAGYSLLEAMASYSLPILFFTSERVAKKENDKLLSAGAAAVLTTSQELVRWVGDFVRERSGGDAGESGKSAAEQPLNDLQRSQINDLLRQWVLDGNLGRIELLWTATGQPTAIIQPILERISEQHAYKSLDEESLLALQADLVKLFGEMQTAPTSFGEYLQTLQTEGTEPTTQASAPEPSYVDEITDIRKLIAEASLGEALRRTYLLVRMIDDKDVANTIDLLTGRYQRNEQSHDTVVIAEDEYRKTRSQINYSLLQVLSELEERLAQSSGTTPDETAYGAPEPLPEVILMPAGLHRDEFEALRRQANAVNELSTGPRYHFSVSVISEFQLDELWKTLQRETLTILHFAGAPKREAVEQPNVYQTQQYQYEASPAMGATLSKEIIQQIGREYGRGLQLVLLAGCYREEWAYEFSTWTPYVAGADETVDESALLLFIQTFYRALAGRHDYSSAFEEARAAAMSLGAPAEAFYWLAGSSAA